MEKIILSLIVGSAIGKGQSSSDAFIVAQLCTWEYYTAQIVRDKVALNSLIASGCGVGTLVVGAVTRSPGPTALIGGISARHTTDAIKISRYTGGKGIIRKIKGSSVKMEA